MAPLLYDIERVGLNPLLERNKNNVSRKKVCSSILVQGGHFGPTHFHADQTFAPLGFNPRTFGL